MFPYKYENLTTNGIKYKLIYIDTNIYNKENDENCLVFKLEQNITDLKFNQNNFIKECLNDESSYYLFFGHEPLISSKTKYNEKTKNVEIKNSILNDELLDFLFESKKDNIYWICADVHMYQYCSITHKDNNQVIRQIVCGTGGADKDYYELPVSKKTFGSNNQFYFMIDNFMDSYGYVEIALGKGFEHKYFKISEKSEEKQSKKYLIYYD